MATDIKEYFSKFFDWNNDPQRFEVYSVLEEATNGFQRGRCEALLYDLRQMVEDWKYKELCDSINRENERRAKQVDEAFMRLNYVIVGKADESVIHEKCEAFERLKQELPQLPPPFPDADTSTIPTPPIFDYAFSLLCCDGEEPPRKAAPTPTAPATGHDDEAATPTPAQLPPELQTDEARKYFERARELGLIDEKYNWLDGKEMLACFAREMSLKLNLGKGVNSDGSPRLSWKPFEQLFGIKSGKLRGNLNDIRNKRGSDPSKGKLIDIVFNC